MIPVKFCWKKWPLPYLWTPQSQRLLAVVTGLVIGVRPIRSLHLFFFGRETFLVLAGNSSPHPPKNRTDDAQFTHIMRITPPPARQYYMQYQGELGDCAQILQSSVHVLLNCTCTDNHRLFVFTVRLLLLQNNRVKNNRNYFITAVLWRKLCRHINHCTMDASLTSPSAALTPPS